MQNLNIVREERGRRSQVHLREEHRRHDSGSSNRSFSWRGTSLRSDRASARAERRVAEKRASANAAKSAAVGIAHGVVDFCLNLYPDVQTVGVYLRAGVSWYSREARLQALENLHRSQNEQKAAIGSGIRDFFSIDESDAVYQTCRAGTTAGLEVGSFFVAGYGIAKGTLTAIRVTRTTVVARGLYRTESAYQGYLLRTHLYHMEEYGACGYRTLSNGRIRYYGELDLAKTKGEMAGRRLVREWDPRTGFKRTWNETVDHSGRVRIARPETNDGNKVHYLFDSEEDFIGIR